MNKNLICIAPEVADALAEKRPVVALESTVITHGLPAPQNLETAVQMEHTVRDNGAIPATIAILDGVIHVGLSAEQLQHLAALDGDTVRKCSRRDIPLAIAYRENGATTVAGTMIIAYIAGIELFATGGIGGVHRGHPFDVSADLTEMGRTPVTIVSSGVKSILDLPATREVLETNGVTVLGWQTEQFPAFFYRNSGLLVDQRVDSAAQAAAIIRTRNQLQLQNAILLANPVPETSALDSAATAPALEQALAELETQGITGAAATPFLLQRLVQLTNGATLTTNTALLLNNAAVAAQVASALFAS